MGAFHESLCLNLQCHSSGNLLSIVSQLSFPDAGAKIRRLLMNYLQYFSTKKVGSYADTHIYSSTFVSLKTLIYSEIYIKPLKTSLFTFFFLKKWKVQFPLPQLAKLTLTLPTPLPFTLLVTDGVHKTKTYCVNKLDPKQVEC